MVAILTLAAGRLKALAGITSSAGSADAGKVPILGTNGNLAQSLAPSWRCPQITFSNYKAGRSMAATSWIADGWQCSAALCTQVGYLNSQIMHNYGNYVVYYPYLVPYPSILKGFGIYVTTSATYGVDFYGALCPVDPQDGLPGDQLVAFNPLSTAATGLITDTATSTWSPAGPITLDAGWYYVQCGCKSGAPKFASRGDSGVAPSLAGPLPMTGGYGRAVGLQGEAYSTANTPLPTSPSGTFTAWDPTSSDDWLYLFLQLENAG